ncbi:MAG: zinc-binding dehydrogenase [Deinococcus sp.]|nr:zinc-binding dehydrogenase [Deinococcus sp.]
MRAMAIQQPGGPEVIQLLELTEPQPGPSEVLVQLKAAALNHLDLFVRSQSSRNLSFPHILGSDGAGIVSQVGPGASRVKVGDAVLINPGISCGACEFCQQGEHSMCLSYHLLGAGAPGTYADFVKVPELNVAPIPSGVSFQEAAAFVLAYLTAWRMLFSRARLQPGEDVLIVGVGGGVACAALQLACHIGARVLVTSGSDAKLRRAKELGAVFGVNYRTQDVVAEVRQFTSKRRVDVVVDNVGASSFETSLACLARGGRLVTVGAATGLPKGLDVHRLYWNQLSIIGSTMGNRREFSAIVKLLGGGFRPIVDVVFPLDKAADAHRYLESQQQFGKVVLDMGS